MNINSLTNHPYSGWGMRYNQIDWKDEWKIFINLWNKETKEIEFHKIKPIGHIIHWFDSNILQRINKDTRSTLLVRIRIVCGMINNISPNKLSRELKMQFMECIWDTYNQFSYNYNEWYCKYILQLPF